MNLLEGASILAARIAASRDATDHAWLRWSPHTRRQSDPRCTRCGAPIEEALVALGSLRCDDCRRPDES
jgi:hypothetical protein